MSKFSLASMRSIKESELPDMKKLASTFRRQRPVYRIKNSFGSGVNIIAELKHSSPAHGALDGHLTDSVRLARYIYGGASAVSILTEREYFGGSYDAMKIASEEIAVPVLCKDFVFFDEQIKAAYSCGADMVLLIAKALQKNELEDLYFSAKNAGIEPLIEICQIEEMDKLGSINPDLLMVNMRNLETMEISFTRGIETLKRIPEGVTAISASGINTAADAALIIKETGVKNFLVGASLMLHNEPDLMIRELKNVC